MMDKLSTEGKYQENFSFISTNLNNKSANTNRTKFFKVATGEKRILNHVKNQFCCTP